MNYRDILENTRGYVHIHVACLGLPLYGLIPIEDEEQICHDFILNIELKDLFNDQENQNKGEVVLQAIDYCCRHDLLIPEWARVAFSAFIESHKRFELSTDEAFLLENRVHLKAKKKASQKWEAWLIGKKLHESMNIPIDDAMFEEIGQHLNISQSLARKFYYDYESISEYIYSQTLKFERIRLASIITRFTNYPPKLQQELLAAINKFDLNYHMPKMQKQLLEALQIRANRSREGN